MTPEKAVLLSLPYLGAKEQKSGFGDCPIDPKELKYVILIFWSDVNKHKRSLIAQIYQLTGLAQTGRATWDLMVKPQQHPMTVWTNLQPWLPAGWVGHTLGFAFAHGSTSHPTTSPSNFALLTCSGQGLYQWCDYIAALFIPSIETTDIMIKVEALTNFMKQALLDNTKAIQVLNEEQIQMRKTVIQNLDDFDILGPPWWLRG